MEQQKTEYECIVCNYSDYFTTRDPKNDYHVMPDKCKRCLRPKREEIVRKINEKKGVFDGYSA